MLTLTLPHAVKTSRPRFLFQDKEGFPTLKELTQRYTITGGYAVKNWLKKQIPSFKKQSPNPKIQMPNSKKQIPKTKTKIETKD